jgi:serine/threonine protein kinase
MRKLCTGAHNNIIRVYGHGALRSSTYHFIDMELCDFDLKEYIHYRRDPTAPNRVPTNHVSGIGDAFGATEVWSIMKQIANGVAYIHSHREAHRDLKPRNGKYHLSGLMIL